MVRVMELDAVSGMKPLMSRDRGRILAQLASTPAPAHLMFLPRITS